MSTSWCAPPPSTECSRTESRAGWPSPSVRESKRGLPAGPLRRDRRVALRTESLSRPPRTRDRRGTRTPAAPDRQERAGPPGHGGGRRPRGRPVATAGLGGPRHPVGDRPARRAEGIGDGEPETGARPSRPITAPEPDSPLGTRAAGADGSGAPSRSPERHPPRYRGGSRVRGRAGSMASHQPARRDHALRTERRPGAPSSSPASGGPRDARRRAEVARERPAVKRRVRVRRGQSAAVFQIRRSRSTCRFLTGTGQCTRPG